MTDLKPVVHKQAYNSAINGVVAILGASWQQVPLISAAMARGFETVVLDRNPKAVGRTSADTFITVDVGNPEACLSALSGMSLDGVITTGVDAAFPTLAKVTTELSLPGPRAKAVETLSDKRRTLDAAATMGILVPDQREPRTIDEAQLIAEELGWPVVVKPSNAAGSVGVSIVEDPDQLLTAWNKAIASTRPSGVVLVEQHIAGIESGIQYFSGNDGIETELSFAHNDLLLPNRIGPMGHSFPHDDETVAYQLRSIAETVSKVLSFAGPLNMDFISTTSGVYLIEVAGRFGGGCLPALIELMYGLSIYDILIDKALGITRPTFELQSRFGGVAAAFVRTSTEGVLTSIESPPDRSNVWIEWHQRAGDYCVPFKSATHAIGTVYATAGSSAAAEILAVTTATEVQLSVEPIRTY